MRMKSEVRQLFDVEKSIAIFNMMLNVASVNGRMLYQFSPSGKQISTIGFLKTLGKRLYEPQRCTRTCNVKIPRSLQNLTADMLHIDVDLQQIHHDLRAKRKRCVICPAKKDRKTNTSSSVCKNQYVLSVQ